MSYLSLKIPYCCDIILIMEFKIRVVMSGSPVSVGWFLLWSQLFLILTIAVGVVGQAVCLVGFSSLSKCQLKTFFFRIIKVGSGSSFGSELIVSCATMEDVFWRTCIVWWSCHLYCNMYKGSIYSCNRWGCLLCFPIFYIWVYS